MSEITYETVADHVRLITMNRPETLNSLSPDGSREQRERIEEFRDDDDAFVLIITGAGERSFSTGADLRARATNYAAEGAAPRPTPQVPPQSLHAYPTLEVWKPVIAAINGYALGGGLELALWCDVRLASENAEMGMLEPRRGSMSVSLVTRLTRTIPLGYAMEMMLTARRYSAQDAYRMGLVSQVVPREQLMPTAIAWASEIATECAPMSVRMTKELVARTLHMPVRDALQFQSLWSLRLRSIAPEDALEGAQAFTERRKPNWKGR
jgi:enoyl-CoA hydratase/carnithine racemase